MMGWTTPYTFTAGFQPTAAKWNEQIRDNLNIIMAAGATAWTSYTPTWTGVGSNPAVGNAIVAGGYTQIGKLAVFRFHIVCGNTTTFGSGEYRWALPVTAEAASRGGATGFLYDSSAGSYYHAPVDYNATTTLRAATGGTTLTWVTNTSPFTWASLDQITVSGFYEAA